MRHRFIHIFSATPVYDKHPWNKIAIRLAVKPVICFRSKWPDSDKHKLCAYAQCLFGRSINWSPPLAPLCARASASRYENVSMIIIYSWLALILTFASGCFPLAPSLAFSLVSSLSSLPLSFYPHSVAPPCPLLFTSFSISLTRSFYWAIGPAVTYTYDY